MHDSLRQAGASPSSGGNFRRQAWRCGASARDFALCRVHVDEIVAARTDEICAGDPGRVRDTRSIVEPAGALAVAGLKNTRHAKAGAASAWWRSKRRNMNFDRLRHRRRASDLAASAKRCWRGDSRAAGSFLHFCEVLGRPALRSSIYRYAAADGAQIFWVSRSPRGAREGHVVQSLRAADSRVTDMTDDEMAKLHVRYMVGGHARASR